MIRFLKDQWWFERSDRRGLALLLAGIEALLLLGTLVAMFLTDPGTDTVSVGVLVLLGASLFLAVFGGAAYFGSEFQLGLKMGATRRQMLAAQLFNTFSLELTMVAASLALGGLEWLFNRFVWMGRHPGAVIAVNGFEILAAMPWWVWPVGLAAPVLLGYITGVTMACYGQKGFWVLWGLFMLCFVVPANTTSGFLKLGQAFSNVPLLALAIAGMVLAVTGWLTYKLMHLSVREGV